MYCCISLQLPAELLFINNRSWVAGVIPALPQQYDRVYQVNITLLQQENEGKSNTGRMAGQYMCSTCNTRRAGPGICHSSVNCMHERCTTSPQPACLVTCINLPCPSKCTAAHTAPPPALTPLTGAQCQCVLNRKLINTDSICYTDYYMMWC